MLGTVDTISSGPDREPWRMPGRPACLVALAVVLVATAAVAVATRDHRLRAARSPVPAGARLRPMLLGVPARRVQTQLVLGGDYLWRVGAGGPQAVAAAFLSAGHSPLAGNAGASEVAGAAGGVVALIDDGSSSGAGRVLYLPAAKAAPRVIGTASLIAVAPGGRRVWLQHGIERERSGDTVTLTSPTWAVNLAGRRVTPVLRLPFGLAAATDSGLIIQSAPQYRLSMWNAASGRPLRMALPQDILATSADRVAWTPLHCGAGACPLEITDLRTGREITIALPGNWGTCCGSGGAGAFDASGQRLALTLTRSSRSGAALAQDVFMVDIATGTVIGMPGGVLPAGGDGITAPAVQMAAAWDRQGLLWVLASSSGDDSRHGYYQLGYWTGAGPLHTFAPARGSPTALSAPGPG